MWALACASVLGFQGQPTGLRVWEFKDALGTYERFQVHRRESELAPPKVAPQTEWKFPFLAMGYVQVAPSAEQMELRFRIYSQQRPETADLGPLVGRFYLRLWELNYDRLKLDHALAFGKRVDVFLCDQGEPGGEQKFTEDSSTPGAKPTKVNAIFIYNIETFTDFFERARELAHEYGHACLPGVGGFSAPENWANGELGERLYLKWIKEEMDRGHLGQIDTMGATSEEIDAYLQRKVTPLVKAAAFNGASRAVLDKMNAESMNRYLGSMMWSESILPIEVFRRGLVLGGATVREAMAGLQRACEERPFELLIPAELRGQKIWVPTGNAVLSGAKPLARRDGWVMIQPGTNPIRVSPPQTSTK